MITFLCKSKFPTINIVIIKTITNQNRFLLWSDVFIFGTIYYLAQLYKQNNDSLPNVEDGGYPVCRSYH